MLLTCVSFRVHVPCCANARVSADADTMVAQKLDTFCRVFPSAAAASRGSLCRDRLHRTGREEEVISRAPCPPRAVHNIKVRQSAAARSVLLALSPAPWAPV
ncbi:hypothetical protein GCM10018966_034230 [Streptomyces yanii]